MMVFHGSTEIVKAPDVAHSFRRLDFGKGFYTTTVKEQAERWARRKAGTTGAGRPIVNRYQMRETMDGLRVRRFADDLTEWIDFVCHCRDGGDAYRQYDVIIGKVANDKVYRVVDMYHSGIWDKARALQEIKAYPDYDQIVFITQKAIDCLLTFDSFAEA